MSITVAPASEHNYTILHLRYLIIPRYSTGNTTYRKYRCKH